MDEAFLRKPQTRAHGGLAGTAEGVPPEWTGRRPPRSPREDTAGPIRIRDGRRSSGAGYWLVVRARSFFCFSTIAATSARSFFAS